MKTRSQARCGVSRLLLVVGLLPALLVKSTVATALVLHRHGVRPAHLHVLGYTNRLVDASSVRYGHVSRPSVASRSDTGCAQVLAIVTTGLVFLSGPDDSAAERAKPGPSADLHARSTTTGSTHSAMAPVAIPRLLQAPKTMCASILDRNHALLI